MNWSRKASRVRPAGIRLQDKPVHHYHNQQLRTMTIENFHIGYI